MITSNAVRALVAIAGASSLVLYASCAFAQEQSSGTLEPKWGPHFDVELKPGTDCSLGEGDLFIPLVQGERTLFFGDCASRWARKSACKSSTRKSGA